MAVEFKEFKIICIVLKDIFLSSIISLMADSLNLITLS
jgi:hypothetical protein